ncbi:F5/8 type C domain-containing protein [Mucilaginibacter pineti]|uniref:F5/8 type C domain-containing protein n=1 Tax=Mucilaginibacter pineti TaxID=1391627 RepID=A0A1G6X0W5_9SPHI|nr:family 43 glycosylhydrolase [Mucilaginibacter pineti]SDD71047.1 F5/8 type C domain-containing protein [Mucilaginibacter pineti]
MRKIFLRIFFLVCLSLTALAALAQTQSAITPGNGNPLIPGYFADPTVRKFGDTFYIYATTDGNGGGHGPSQVWTSKDFVNWTMKDMNWPTTNYYWAPDVINGNDGKYYMYYCQPVEIYGASSATPVGPWTPLLPDGKAMIPNYFIPGVITLDGQTFKDDDGKIYMFWGTWGIYPDHGCGVGLLNADMHSFAKTAKIPNTIAKDFFEAPFMFKRKGIYYLTYSSGACEDSTYRVQYAISRTGAMGPFEFGKNNPVLSTNSDGTIHGPGHESVVQVGDDFYMVYHRHNNPHSTGGYHRQVCADKLVFDKDGNIEKMVPTHTGVGLLGKNEIITPNLAYQKKVSASSYYNENYRPSFAVDDNNGTLWKPADNSTQPASITIDLGGVIPFNTVATQFEYATWYYQYTIETSVNGTDWQAFANQSTNTHHGSPMVDYGDVKARFIRITVTGTEYPGLYKAIWNVKVYNNKKLASGTIKANVSTDASIQPYQQKGLLIDLDASQFQPGTVVSEWTNKGLLGGKFIAGGKPPLTDIIGGKKALVFNDAQSLQSTVTVPASLYGNNSYTVDFWAYNTKTKDENPVLSWTRGESDHTGANFGYGSNRVFGAAQHFGASDFQYKGIPEPKKWHHVIITFDGIFEKLYVDGVLNNIENKMLFLRAADKFIIGAKTNRSAFFTGAIASLKVYDRPLADTTIQRISSQTQQADIAVYLNASKLNYGSLGNWANEGDAGGLFKTANEKTPVVKDVAGRLAVSFSGKDALVLDTKLTDTVNYSIAYTLYKTNKWQYIVSVFDVQGVKEYVNGALVSPPIQQAVKITDGTITLGNNIGAIAGVTLYKHSLQVDEIKQLNDAWLQNLHPPVAASAQFKVKPNAVTPSMVYMEAGTDGAEKASLQYCFTEKEGKSSGWIDEPQYIAYQLSADKTYSYSFKIKDNFGNVSTSSAQLKVSTATTLFHIISDDFSKNRNFVQQGQAGTVWNGLIGKGNQQQAKVFIDSSSLTLQSKGTNWDGGAPYGPFLYQNVTGDFVVQVEVTDVSGLKEKKVKGNNDVGLMIRKEKDTTDTNTAEQLLQSSIFPAWNCGNMFTNFKDGQRMQVNTQTGWNYNRFLQIQKSGDVFYIRSSKDGLTWEDMPGSPTTRPDLANIPLQIGLFQCTYGPQESYVKFGGYKLITKK